MTNPDEKVGNTSSPNEPEDEQTIDTAVSGEDEEPRTLDVTDSGAEDQQTGEEKPEKPPESEFESPEELPILPLRGLVVYPHTTIPLTVGQPRSIKLVDEAVAGDRLIGLVASHNPELETPGPDEIYGYGTIAQIHRLFRAPDGTIRLLVQGMARMRVEDYTASEPYLKARVVPAPETVEEGIEVEALMRNIVEQFSRMADLVPSLATYIRLDLEDQQKLLELDSVLEKLRTLMTLLNKELEVLELGHRIQTEAQSEIEKTQREYFLREQLKAIQRELGEGDEQTVEIEEFRQKIEAAHMPEEAEREARRELDRMAKLPTIAAEYGVIRTYLDWMVSLPWDVMTEDNLDIAHARAVLDEDHYGLDDIKERILEYLAVRKLRQERAEELAQRTQTDYVRREREGAILCFVGPPGVGKTSLGASIARAMERKFTRMSLGGGIRPARGAGPGAKLRVPRSLPGRAVRLVAGVVHYNGQHSRHDPDAPARPHGDHPAQRLYRAGKSPDRPTLPDPAPDS